MRLILSLFLLCVTFNAKSQSDSSECYALRVVNKKYLNDTLLLQTKLSKQGYFVLTNGVYDFVFKDKTYRFHRVFKITGDSISIGYVFDSIPSKIFSINELTAIKLWICRDGTVEFPNYIINNRQKYQLDIIKQKEFCALESLTTIEVQGDDIFAPGYYYLTSFDFYEIFRKNNEDFVKTGLVIIKIKRPRK